MRVPGWRIDHRERRLVQLQWLSQEQNGRTTGAIEQYHLPVP
jgi:hypothetical protein